VLGLDEERMRLLELAALMHDVGKIALSDSVLTKAGPLDAAEWREVRDHPVGGERILGATELVELLPWVRGHHERWDGTGYPDGLAGREIPLEARILCVCDAYDAMVSERTYRAAMTPAAARAQIAAGAGTQFDPHVAEELLLLLEAAEASNGARVSEASEIEAFDAPGTQPGLVAGRWISPASTE